MAPNITAILGDVTCLQQRGNPLYVPHLVEHITGILIYRFSQAQKRSRQAINWCSFLKNSPETFRSEIYFGAFLACSLSKSVFQKARKCSELSSNILGICSLNQARKVILEAEDSLIIFFSGIKLNTYFTHEPSCSVLQCFHILSLTVKACQISLDYWLFA